MAKQKSAFYCKNCGNESPKWLGKCPACNEWNTYIEEPKVVASINPKNANPVFQDKKLKPIKINDVSQLDYNRIVTGDTEFDNVMGGGIVKGSITLIGGEPGIGKSTLLLQIALSLKSTKILYVSGEESMEQIKMRAERIKDTNDKLYLYSETNTQFIFKTVQDLEPDLVIIDSVQTVYTDNITSSAGSISQVRETASEFQKLAKTMGTSVILIGHINKDGEIAGPKLLEHIVDTVLQFEGDRHYNNRILRSIKNRFGSQMEMGIYEMNEKGLRPVTNPSEILLNSRKDQFSGISIACAMEGARPLLIETQALVASAVYGNPQRTATGFDVRRLNMLLAVLEKRAGFALTTKDVFLNIAGGIKIIDPAIDLSIVCSIMSSYQDVEISHNYAFSAEVGLSGEIRSISRIEQRIQEADKLGFEKIFVSKGNYKSKNSKLNIDVIEVSKILQYETIGSAGMDIRANIKDTITINSLERTAIPTGLYIELPIGYEAQVRPRSGLAIKQGLSVLNSPGTIDSDYRGEIQVIVANLSKDPIVIQNGDRIAQMVIAKYEQAIWQEVDMLSNTDRGIGGFGSTGVNN
ncbi:unnamed protein product [Cyprideis torosa]|uniref:Uncharacterized protein n=1 Tax=Cyprideis torosa TaxID=163714 RepID=A0A7R8WIH1_9CRUS|nr:unnamed protein product [Cyprideis torosa]CAG0894476.1 unnamed protein product [Cyprideis torosa]